MIYYTEGIPSIPILFGFCPRKCHRKFSLKTVLMMAEQMIDCSWAAADGNDNDHRGFVRGLTRTVTWVDLANRIRSPPKALSLFIRTRWSIETLGGSWLRHVQGIPMRVSLVCFHLGTPQAHLRHAVGHNKVLGFGHFFGYDSHHDTFSFSIFLAKEDRAGNVRIFLWVEVEKSRPLRDVFFLHPQRIGSIWFALACPTSEDIKPSNFVLGPKGGGFACVITDH